MNLHKICTNPHKSIQNQYKST